MLNIFSWFIFLLLNSSLNILSRIKYGASNSLDLDQARRNVGPDLGPNCLQMLSADYTSRHRYIGDSLSIIKTDNK